jgi:antitoxin (DNA-binding transcriptional repressor) of toxin-antitoxin stability system
MVTITIHKAKTNLSRLIEKACRGEEVVIARGKTERFQGCQSP